MVNNSVNVRLRDLPKLGAILDKVTSSGANSIGSIQFDISNRAELLDQAEATLGSLYGALREVQDIELDVELSLEGEAFYAALNDDLNTPVAIAEIHALVKSLNKASDADKPALKARILAAGNLLGILGQDPEAWMQGGVDDDGISAADIEALIAERQQAKLDKNYARADEIRQELAAQGVVLEDSREGTKWRRE